MKSLKRRLGLRETFCIAAGAMISSGLFVLPGQAFKVCGAAVVLAYGLAALMVIPALLSQAELATAMPRSGGTYFFIERSMGALPGTLAGLANWLSLALKSAFAMIGIGAFAQLIWPDADLTPEQWEWLIKGVAIVFCVVFTALNVFSVRMAGWLQVVMVFGLLGVLGVFAVAGLPSIQQHPNFDNVLGKGFDSVLATAALIFVSFGGLTKVAGVAEEVRRPGHNVPRAMFLAYIVVSLLYILVVFVVVGVMDAEQLSAGPYGNLTPVSVAAGSFFGRGGLVVLSAAAMLAFVTTGNAGILSASRSPLAMSRDGLLPRRFAKVSRRFGTPYVSVLLTGGFMIAMIALLRISDLVKVASTMMLILFLLVNVAVLVMRGSRLQNYRPLYRSPLYPWVQIAGVLIYAALVGMLAAKLGPVPLLTAGGFIVAALVWYFVYVRPRSSRESALVYMVRNVVAKEIYRSELEAELRDIAIHRDEVAQDRFDHLVTDCDILDLPDAATADELFDVAAEMLALRLHKSKESLVEGFRNREDTSSTVIQPGLAIPHVIVEGKELFDILPVRCREGIRFAEDQAPVQTAFILVGSADERNYHLRALMAIAQIVQEKGFLTRWLEAQSLEHLRDILLLSTRTRDGAKK